MEAPQQPDNRTRSPSEDGPRGQTSRRYRAKRAKLRHDVAVVAAELRRMRHAGLGRMGAGGAAPVGE